MKLIRFKAKGKVYMGSLQADKLLVDSTVFDLNEVKILPPCSPSKVICVGLNYSDHAKEINIEVPTQPVLFLKPSTSIIADKEKIIYPKMSQRIDYEGELAVIIKDTAKDITIDEAANYILGYTCSNDITARDLQKPNEQWTICKSFDTFLPLGPTIATDIEPHDLEIKTYVNGMLKQHSNTKYLIFNIYYLISYISRIMTLLPGDVVLTGTPVGIGPMLPGDEVVVEIQNIGRLTNYVVAL